MKITAAGATHVGKVRYHNEDAFGIFTDPHPDPDLPYAQGGLFVVADGLGGHAGGEVASRIAVEVLKTFCPLPMEEGDRNFLDAVQAGHLRIQEEGRRKAELRGMGTTLVAAHILDRKCVVLHAGDSRAYLIRGETLHPVTRDHTLVEEMIRAGVLPPEAVHTHPDRRILSRALGVEESLRLDRNPVSLEDGDLILLCSDGLTNMLSDETIRREILSIGTKDPSAIVQGLIDRANERGGIDNITVVAIRAEDPPRNTVCASEEREP